MYKYRIYDLEIEANFPFMTHMLPGMGNADLIITWEKSSELPVLSNENLIFSSPSMDFQGEPVFRYYRFSDHDSFVHTGFTLFDVNESLIRIYCRQENLFIAERNLLSNILAWHLEQHEVLAFHASAVVLQSGAVAFLAHSTMGKSSVAASFLDYGLPLLTDDILPVELINRQYFGRPGYPSINLSPSQVKNFFGDREIRLDYLPKSQKAFFPVGPDGWGSFCPQKQPLKAFYILNRVSEDMPVPPIKIDRLIARQAVAELIRYSFTPRLIQATGGASSRLMRLATLVANVPVFYLTYKTGHETLSVLVDELLRSNVPNSNPVN